MAERVVRPLVDRVLGTRKVTDPTLIFYVLVHRHLPGHVEEDPRLLLLQEMDRFAETYGLEPPPDAAAEWPHARGQDVDLVSLHRSSAEFERLVSLLKQEPERLLACLAYAYHDTLVIEIVVGRLGWTGPLVDGWNDVFGTLCGGFPGDALEPARQRTVGASAVYWALATDDPVRAGPYAEDVATIMDERSLRRTDTDIGTLWRSDSRSFAAAISVSQDRWVLITPRSEETEADERYSKLQGDGPCDFVRVALARHKVAYEEAQYTAARAELERRQETLDRRTRWIVHTQAYHGPGLRDLQSRESIEFQEKLSRAHTNFADYSQSATDVKELRQTVEVNRTNFLTGCVALVSAEGERLVESSPRHDQAAMAFLAEYRQSADREEGIFRPELGRMQTLCDQLDADIYYSEQVMARHAASLRSGGEQLGIAGQREIGEISAHGGLEAAAAVAAISALVAVELLRTGNTLNEEPLLSASVILLTVSATFAAVERLSAGRVRGGLQRYTFAAAAGFLVSSLAAIPVGGDWSAAFVHVGPFLVGSAAGFWAHRRLEFRARRRQRREQQHAVEAVNIDKLIYATEELPELLEDLPPTKTFRIKDPQSLVEKIERKNAERAAKLEGGLDELRRRREAYDITDVADAIGIRYVVPPERVVDVVDRVRAVAQVEAIEYKNQTTELRGGRYDGFRMNYKSIHIDLDLWGVGARKDVNLVAEVQVRTRIQNWFADWFHDIMYKPRPAPAVAEPTGWRSIVLRALLLRRLVVCARQASARGGPAPWLVRFFDLWHPWLNRPLARVAIWVSDWQLRRFRELMEWPPEDARAAAPTSPAQV